MTYHVEFSNQTKKELKKLDNYIKLMIMAWIRKNIEGCTNLRQHGKGLTANRSDQWRYRVGNYRIIAEIQDEKVIVLVLSVGHRKDVYD